MDWAALQMKESGWQELSHGFLVGRASADSPRGTRRVTEGKVFQPTVAWVLALSIIELMNEIPGSNVSSFPAGHRC